MSQAVTCDSQAVAGSSKKLWIGGGRALFKTIVCTIQSDRIFVFNFHDMVDHSDRNSFDDHEISVDPFVYICDVAFEIRARHRDTRELPLEQRPNLHQAGDPIEKRTDLLKHRYIKVV